MGWPRFSVAKFAEKSNSRSAKTVSVASLTAEVISTCKPELGAGAACSLTRGKDDSAAKKVFDEVSGKSRCCFSWAATCLAERFGCVENSFGLPPGDDAEEISNSGVAVACDVWINASGGTAAENRTPAGGGGTTSRARTEWIIGTLEASKRQAAAAIQASCRRVGFDHQDLFLISGAPGCVRARASGYRAEASSSHEANRPPRSFARHRVTM